ncbi:tyrosine--tRNA ligase [Candidatus Saccharibacteria bacterium]|nr:tyrosine--tRNA ligase [Candidatus Saccharibacteria bacterium]
MLSTDEVFTRWVDKIYPRKKDLQKALAQRKLTVYHGVDPTGSDLHLGHSVPLLLLKNLQAMGHKIIFLIGDATATVGDPSERTAARKRLTRNQVKKNAQTYKKQAGKIINFSGKNSAKLDYNSRWWGKMRFLDGLALAYQFTLQQMIERDMFQVRLKRRNPISLPELFYPVLQGYDSVAMDVDAEVGGTDQTFNMLAGRALMKKLKGKEKFVLATKLLVNPKTQEKFSKSSGNYIPLTVGANDMYGKVMALPDEMVIITFKLCTEVPLARINKLEKEFKSNPLKVKKLLAYDITSMYHGKDDARKAQKEFEKVFQKKGLPTPTVRKVTYTADAVIALTVDVALVKTGLAKSMSDARRLIDQGAVKVNGEKILGAKTTVAKDDVLSVGKRKAVKIA